MRADAGALEPAGAEAIAHAFARAILARDALAAASCLSPAACLLSADGTEVRGRGAVVELLGQITAGPELEIRVGQSLLGEDVALCTQFWQRRATGRPGGRFESQTTARLVLARRSGRWQIAIACPWD